MKRIISTALIFSALTFTVLADEQTTKAKPKAVLVTGASSGIGAKITEVLSSKGFFVYAGARKDEDLKRLEAMDNVESIRLDVTIQEQIDAAVELVRSKGRGLYGLINNAGVVILGPLTEVPVEELQYQLDVNVLGPYRVTQAFAPLIIESKGRITTTGSIAGILSGNMFGLYAMSKHAIEGYTDSLASEMARFDVKVSVIEPGNYKSKIGQTFAKRFAKKNYLKEKSAYQTDMQAMVGRLKENDQAKDPLDVALAAYDAMSADQPKRRYMVTPTQAQAQYTIRQAMREMLQLNHQQPYTLDREALVKMLDQVSDEL